MVGVPKLVVPGVWEFEWCDAGDVGVWPDRVRSGSVLLEPAGDGDPEWVVNRVGRGVEEFFGVAGGVVAGVGGVVCREPVVVWRGSMREWRVGESSWVHADCLEEGGRVATVDEVESGLVRFCNRWIDLTAVLFLESGRGGELFFPGLGVEVVPRAGCGVVFDSWLLHEVRRVEVTRVSFVSFVSRARVLANFGVALGGGLPLGWDVDCLDPGPVLGFL
jgi:hypothetical protein